ncbi:hypothetical protein PR048_030374 [Dryococelus australis]|uniref:Uncharacterized protein n=1 Tax=Dryococelus australis TaxID=614101 RepID=A0ABQ9G9A4_9NEOP|nr:hypothetical protein PR048_030374 [Dryococelus australis]
MEMGSLSTCCVVKLVASCIVVLWLCGIVTVTAASLIKIRQCGNVFSRCGKQLKLNRTDTDDDIVVQAKTRTDLLELKKQPYDDVLTSNQSFYTINTLFGHRPASRRVAKILQLANRMNALRYHTKAAVSFVRPQASYRGRQPCVIPMDVAARAPINKARRRARATRFLKPIPVSLGGAACRKTAVPASFFPGLALGAFTRLGRDFHRHVAIVRALRPATGRLATAIAFPSRFGQMGNCARSGEIATNPAFLQRAVPAGCGAMAALALYSLVSCVKPGVFGVVQHDGMPPHVQSCQPKIPSSLTPPTSRGAVGRYDTDLGCGRLWVRIPDVAYLGAACSVTLTACLQNCFGAHVENACRCGDQNPRRAHLIPLREKGEIRLEDCLRHATLADSASSLSLKSFPPQKWLNYSPPTLRTDPLPGFSHVGIVPGDSVGRQVFSGYPSPLTPSFIQALLYTNFTLPSSALDVETGAKCVSGLRPLRLQWRESMQGDMHRGREGLGSHSRMVARALASHDGDPGSLPDFRMWGSCRTMALVGRISRGSPVSPGLSLRRCSILTSLHKLNVKSCSNLFSTLSVY